MGTTGTFTFDLNGPRDITNYSIQTAERVVQEVANQGDLIGLGIAIALALTLIFGAVFIALGFLPKLITSIKRLKK